jgi:hypothetical protein
MLAAAFLLANPINTDCQAFTSQLGTPVEISVSRIAAERLAAGPFEATSSGTTDLPEFRIGDLYYRGHGVEMRSADPRFSALIVNKTQDVHHPCRYFASGPSGWNASDPNLQRWKVTFERRPGQDEVPPGTLEADKKGVLPTLKGARSGSSWPVYSPSGSYFLGVMHPTNDPATSLIVAFPDQPGRVPVRTLARLRMNVQGFSVTPGLHDSSDYLNFVERTHDGSILKVVLEFREADATRIGSDFKR